MSRAILEEIVDTFYEESEEIHEEAKALDTPPSDPDQIKNYHEAEKLGKADALMSAAQHIEKNYLADDPEGEFVEGEAIAEVDVEEGQHVRFHVTDGESKFNVAGARGPGTYALVKTKPGVKNGGD